MFAYKWRDWKVHFIELGTMRGSPEPLNVPKIYNLIVTGQATAFFPSILSSFTNRRAPDFPVR